VIEVPVPEPTTVTSPPTAAARSRIPRRPNRPSFLLGNERIDADAVVGNDQRQVTRVIETDLQPHSLECAKAFLIASYPMR
jgi:hypothetical protein